MSLNEQQESDAMKVKNFTEQSKNIHCPTTPQIMSRESVHFTIRMVMSELHELAATVSYNREDADSLMLDALRTIDPCKKFSYEAPYELIGAQADSMVDAWYYMLNIGAKHGMNLSSIFNIVHEANMNKRDKLTGQFIIRESDGKIVKPADWKEPNITGEIIRQFKEGPF